MSVGGASRAPHVRAHWDVPALMRCVLIATLPCLAMALYNTGYQVNRAFESGASMPEDWRHRLLEAIGIGYSSVTVGDCLAVGAVTVLPLLVASALGAWSAESAFARLRGRAADHAALPVIVVLFTLCLPPSLPLAKAALGAALAVFLGKDVFGGVGRNFLNPALTGLALLYFAYPGSLTGPSVWIAVDGFSGATPLAVARETGMAGVEAAGLDWWGAAIGRRPGAIGATSPLACALGAIVLLYTGAASWRILAGGLLGLAIGAPALTWLGAPSPVAELSWYWHAVTGGFAFGIVFLATDPVTATATNPGRWLYGVFIGFLVVAIRIANPAHPEGVMLAILLGNVGAPLIDRGVALVWMRRSGGWHVG